MPVAKQPVAKKIWGVGACVEKRVKDLLRQEAIRRKLTIGRIAGEILTEWSEGKVLEEEKGEQYLLYRYDQTPKAPRKKRVPSPYGLAQGAQMGEHHRRGRY